MVLKIGLVLLSGLLTLNYPQIDSEKSYETMIESSELSKQIIDNNTINFENKKFTFIGDSITQGAGLSDDENYVNIIKNNLNIKDVINLGISGSSIGSYGNDSIINRYKDIPKDSDYIFVFAGINDSFLCNTEMFGDKEKEGTFLGDTDKLMKDIKKEYSDAELYFITTYSTRTFDFKKERNSELLTQEEFVNGIIYLAKENDINIIDMYHDNILNTYSDFISDEYTQDTIHPNEKGSLIIGDYISSKIISDEKCKIENIKNKFNELIK